jgi:DMSO/TMAO reductase YedYZ molybdopterin-dependent catalytic subunit
MTALLAALLLAATPDAGAPLTLKVEGDLIKNASLSLKELTELGAVTVDWTDRHAKDPAAAACAATAQKSDAGCGHKVTGVRLDRVLLRLGFSEGPTGPQANPKQKHQGLRGVVIASAADGFEAVFSVGELLETLGATNALVVWEMDGQPLPAGLGPFRILVLTDKGASRSIHQVTGLRVLDLKSK